jgi:hypothetical protein
MACVNPHLCFPAANEVPASRYGVWQQNEPKWRHKELLIAAFSFKLSVNFKISVSGFLM